MYHVSVILYGTLNVFVKIWNNREVVSLDNSNTKLLAEIEKKAKVCDCNYIRSLNSMLYKDGKLNLRSRLHRRDVNYEGTA
jgi:predicted permease